MARILLDTDVVSLYRTGRLPADFVRHVAGNDVSIAFATAGELWKWALPGAGATSAAGVSSFSSTRR